MSEQHTEPDNQSNISAPQKTSNNKKWILAAVVVIVLVAIGQLFSPERMAERMLEESTGGAYKVDIDKGNQMRITGENGEDIQVRSDGSVEVKGVDGDALMASGDNVALPEKWPTDAPLPTDAVLGFVSTSNTSDGLGMSISFTSEQSPSALGNFYKDALERNGWKIDMSVLNGDGVMYSASKMNETLVVYAASEGTGSSLSMTVTVTE